MIRQLKKSEKILLAGGGVILVIFLLFFLLRGGGGGTVEGDPAELMMQRDVLLSQINKYRHTSAKIDIIDKKISRTPVNYDLIGEMSKTCKELGLTVENIDPRDSGSESDPFNEKSVTINLEDVTLQSLVDLLRKIENSQAFLKVTRMNVKRKTFNEQSLLNVRIRVAVYWPKKNQEAGG